MIGVVEGIVTIVAVAVVGYVLARTGVAGAAVGEGLARLAFFAASPALLLTVMARTPLESLWSGNLLVACLALGAVVVLHVLLTRRSGYAPGERIVGALCAGYVNAGNLGLPIALYVLGDVRWVAPVLLLQLLVVTPAAMAALAVATGEAPPRPRRVLAATVANPITLGALAGLALAAADATLPRLVAGPVDVLAAMAVPSMLLALGMSLHHGPRLRPTEAGHEVWVPVVLKVLVMPAVALVAGLALGLGDDALRGAVVVAALPTAQNVFVYAARHRTGVRLARDTIVLSTLVAVPLVLVVVVLAEALAPG